MGMSTVVKVCNRLVVQQRTVSMVKVANLETTYSPDTGILDIYFLRAAVAAGCLKLLSVVEVA